LHGMRNREATKYIRRGRRTVRLEMFERGGGAGMIFRYRGSDTGNKMIVVPLKAMKGHRARPQRPRRRRQPTPLRMSRPRSRCHRPRQA
jgi:hypothetical protein